MANPTSNFGWQMPTNTDLVKDLPADFETFGQAVDTSMADLKGGTTGQILSKNSNTDMDFIWIANDQGDITQVSAGTGLTGGGTSGAVTLTNDMATTITAAGDIVVGTGSGTYDNLPIGTTGQVLTADTTVSPYKVKWASASSTPSFKGVYTYIASDLTLNNNTSTAITYDTENFDTDGFHSNTTNKDRITIPAGLGGYYLVVVGAQWNSGSSGYRQITILKNNTTNVLIFDYPGFTVSNSYIGKSTIVNLSAGDYINASGYQNSGGSLALGGGAVATFFSVQYLGA